MSLLNRFQKYPSSILFKLLPFICLQCHLMVNSGLRTAVLDDNSSDLTCSKLSFFLVQLSFSCFSKSLLIHQNY